MGFPAGPTRPATESRMNDARKDVLRKAIDRKIGRIGAGVDVLQALADSKFVVMDECDVDDLHSLAQDGYKYRYGEPDRIIGG